MKHNLNDIIILKTLPIRYCPAKRLKLFYFSSNPHVSIYLAGVSVIDKYRPLHTISLQSLRRVIFTRINVCVITWGASLLKTITAGAAGRDPRGRPVCSCFMFVLLCGHIFHFICIFTTRPDKKITVFIVFIRFIPLCPPGGPTIPYHFNQYTVVSISC